MPQKNNVAYAVFVCFIVWFLFDVHLHNRSGRRSWATERVGTIGRIIHRIIPDKKTEMRNIKKLKREKIRRNCRMHREQMPMLERRDIGRTVAVVS